MTTLIYSIMPSDS